MYLPHSYHQHSTPPHQPHTITDNTIPHFTDTFYILAMPDYSVDQSTTLPDRRDSMSPSRLTRPLTMKMDQIAMWNELSTSCSNDLSFRAPINKCADTQGLQTREREVGQVQAVEPLHATEIAIQLHDHNMTTLEYILIFAIVFTFLSTSAIRKALLVAVLLVSHIDSTLYTNTKAEFVDIEDVSVAPVTSTSNDEISAELTDDVVKMPTKLESSPVLFVVLILFITCMPFHVFFIIALASWHFFKNLHETGYITKATAKSVGVQIANPNTPVPQNENTMWIEDTPSVSKYANQGTSMDGSTMGTGDASVQTESETYADKETSMGINAIALEPEKIATNNSTQTDSKGDLTLGSRLNALFNSVLSDDEIVGRVKTLLGELKRATPAVHTPVEVPTKAKQDIVDKTTTLKLNTQWQSASKAWLRGFDDLSAWSKKNDEVYWNTSIDDTTVVLEETDKKDRIVPTKKEIILANLAEDDALRQSTIPLLPPPATGSLAADPRYDWEARLAYQCANEKGIYNKYSFWPASHHVWVSMSVAGSWLIWDGRGIRLFFWENWKQLWYCDDFGLGIGFNKDGTVKVMWGALHDAHMFGHEVWHGRLQNGEPPDGGPYWYNHSAIARSEKLREDNIEEQQIKAEKDAAAAKKKADDEKRAREAMERQRVHAEQVEKQKKAQEKLFAAKKFGDVRYADDMGAAQNRGRQPMGHTEHTTRGQGFKFGANFTKQQQAYKKPTTGKASRFFQNGVAK
ncbi:hypothetical protein K505DRAFT_421991 [Melanomma pulvis-pyrius CBS 109.77]|uniref:Uncharacterized protein n=1 Tax=Melanomma pulvis-pyrius CBS 109.77 TaxID=1314802 RepID=A0A6A6WT56_9PLEO|nr:hypothetical protein K505DRAFT_421991 [Melanomma pulvis-pyrius CBS 109.77]